ncbi:phosphoglycerate dehydrogenase [Deltaproteobacteria bacterium TL4]
MPKIFISTVPFGEIDRTPLDLLEQTGWDYQINPLGRKLTPEEVGAFVKDGEGLIAGTENLDVVLKTAKNLKIISRVGIGLDSVPLAKCKELGITVAYTPDAVTHAVAEFTVGMMVSVTRYVCQADRNARKPVWKRFIGKRIGESVLGIIGVGRIGTQIIRLISGFKPKEILVNDLKDKTQEIQQLRDQYGLCIRQVEKEEIYKNADILSLHVPLSPLTRNLINKDVFPQFRKDVFLINQARGGIVNESDLYEALKAQTIAGAAIDVFEQEPYTGPLTELENIVLTQHMGSCSFDCRSRMEIEAAENLIRFFKKEPLLGEVPEEEYTYQQQ